MLSSNISSRRPHNMVNFGPLAAEIGLVVWGTPANFNGFRVLVALLHGTTVVGVRQNAALNRGRHLYSAGRPSRWALAHILVVYRLRCLDFVINRFCMKMFRTTDIQVVTECQAFTLVLTCRVFSLLSALVYFWADVIDVRHSIVKFKFTRKPPCLLLLLR